MRNTIILLLISVFSVFAEKTHSQSQMININKKNVYLIEIMEEIEDQTSLLFIYNDRVDVNVKTSISANQESIKNILDKILKNTDISYSIEGNHIILSKKGVNGRSSSRQIEKKITGTVVDTNGEPIIGANVVVKGSLSNGTTTDIDGRFSLTIPDKTILSISYIGYNSKEISVEDENNIHIVLLEDLQTLEEVIVVGYGTQKKRDYIGSISSLSAEDVMKTAPTSIESTLQGMAAGVQVNSGAGLPGAPQQIKIRGISSISSGTDPLWIVDGIPIQSTTMDYSFDGEVNQSILSMLNPNDIESIQVLKDAAATSIYGSRGSNGVILVTTKSGKKGVTKVSADIKTGFSNWTKSDIGLANNKDYISIMDLAMNNTYGSKYDIPNIVGVLDGATETMTREEALATNTNWADEISRTGSFSEANVSVSQGGEKGNSYLSLKYRKDNGNLKYNEMETLSANVNLSYNLLNCFDLGYRLFATYTDNDRIKSGDGKNGAGGWAQINSNALPWMKVKDTTGKNGYWNSMASVNALASIDPINAQSNLKTVNIMSGLSGILNLPIKGLKLKGEYGINYIANRARSWRGDALRVNGAVAEEMKYETSITNYNAYFNYDLPLNAIHALNVVAGVENTRQYTHYMTLKGEGLVGVFPEVGTPNTISGHTEISNESYLRGFFSRVNYKLFNRYLLGASIRRDGISKFTKTNRWATFLSGSLGWIISDEKFFTSDKISLLKLRGSFGQTGNTNIPSGITTDSYTITSGSNTLEGFNNTSLNSIGNSDIKWETTNSLDVGVDFGLFQNKINGSVAYYQQRVSDMLLAVSLPLSAGISGGNLCWQNIGDMKNEGFEFELHSSIISKKDFTWSVGFNLSTNKNKILSLDPESDKNGTGILQKGEGDVVRTITKKGLAFGTWYMAEYAGVDAEKGIPLIYEVETLNDGTTRHTGNVIPATNENITNNRMILEGKTSLPKVVGGLNTNITYKNFDFGMVFSFAGGNYIYSRLLQSAMTPNAGMLVLNKKLLTDSWTTPGDNKKWAQVVAGNLYFYDNEGNPTTLGVSYGSDNQTPSSQYLEDGSFLKMRNLTIGYTLPQNWVQPYNLNNVRLYVTGNNLFTWTKFSGYDPEIEIEQESGGAYSTFSSMPSSRSFMFGLSINF
ncbi:MAG: TonB-dependent receptor [Massilibacteroides sp.]|nr:TonB-dependent receptor [Massilibacteroides sp.]